MLIDTHAHVNFSAFKEDADEVLKQALAKQVFVINVGSQYSTSKRAVEYSSKYNKVIYAAVGLHPMHELLVGARERRGRRRPLDPVLTAQQHVEQGLEVGRVPPAV